MTQQTSDFLEKGFDDFDYISVIFVIPSLWINVHTLYIQENKVHALGAQTGNVVFVEAVFTLSIQLATVDYRVTVFLPRQCKEKGEAIPVTGRGGL
jgi:hypothetical protein